MTDEILGKYDEVKDLYETFTLKMASLIREILSGHNINIHSVTSRTKDRKSLAKKLNKLDASYASLEEVTDVSAIRITTYFEDDVDRVVEILISEFSIDEKNSVDKRLLLDPDRFGYLSTHHVASLSTGRCTYTEYRRFANLKFEIQTRSILQHAWAEIEHDLGYKSILEVPKEIRRRFSRLSGLLELADSEFIEIRNQLGKYNDTVLEHIGDSPEAVELNKDALLAFAQNDPLVQELDQQIANLGRWSLVVQPERMGGDLNSLNFVGIYTIADLKVALELNSIRVKSFAEVWVPHSSKLDRKEIGIGISFNFLAHILSHDQGKLLGHLEGLGVTESMREFIAEEISKAIEHH